LNGTQTGNATVTITGNYTKPIVMGEHSRSDESNGAWFNGTIDEVRVWVNTSYGNDTLTLMASDLHDNGRGDNMQLTKYYPVVSLESPDEGNSTTNRTPTFTFNYTSDTDTANCTLYINDTAYGTNGTVNNATSTNITANASITPAGYVWWINCTDEDNDMNKSDVERNITINNNVPTVDTLILNSSANQNKTNESLTCYFTVSDIDGDSIVNTTYWFVDSVLNTTFTNETTITAANTTAKEVWLCNVTITDSYNTTSNNSDSITLLESKTPSVGLSNGFSSLWFDPPSLTSSNINATNQTNDLGCFNASNPTEASYYEINISINQSLSAGWTYFCDDDNTVAGAVVVNSTPQVIIANLTKDNSSMIWCWLNLSTPTQTEDIETVFDYGEI
jgi:hypothetical protein